MIALWWCLSVSLAFLMGWCARVLVERMNAESDPLSATECEPFSFAIPLSPDEKRRAVEIVSLDERRLRKAGR